MTPPSTSRVDLHCHSTASAVSKLGVQRALGPAGVRHAARGGLRARQAPRDGLRDDHRSRHDRRRARARRQRYDDAFVSEELTAWFRGEPQAVHILCWGITPDDHERLQALAGDVEAVAERAARARDRLRARAPVLRRRGAAAAAPPPPPRAALPDLGDAQRLARPRAQRAGRGLHRDARRHRRRRLRRPRRRRHRPHVHRDAARARRWRDVPRPRRRAATPRARGEQGSAAKWTHAAMGARDPRARPRRRATAPRRTRGRLRRWSSGSCSEGDARTGATGTGLGPDDARALLRAWLDAVELDLDRGRAARAACRPTTSRHADLFRRARRCHERKLAQRGRRDRRGGARRRGPRCRGDDALRRLPGGDPLRAGRGLPRPREGQARPPRRRAAARRARRRRASAACTASRTRSTSCASAACPASRSRSSAPTRNVDRRLSAVAEIDIPFYAGLKVGVPSLPAIVEALAEGRYDLVHLCSPGPVGRRRGGHRPGDGRAGARQLPHRARRLRRPALAGPGARGRRADGDRRLLRPVPTACCRRAARPTRCCARWASPTSASAAGTAASTSAASRPQRRDAGPAARRDHRALRRAA